MKIEHTRSYTAARRAEYPPVGDQLDAVFKLATFLAETGTLLPAEVHTWVQQIQAVKDRYPKPQ